MWGIIASIGLIVVSLVVMVVCLFPTKKRIGHFVDTSDIELVYSDYPSIEIGYVYVSRFKKQGAFATDKEIIIFNKGTVEYYSICDKKGLGKISSAVVHVAAGHLVGVTLDSILGEKRKLLFLRLNNKKRILVITTEAYYINYIDGRCKKKRLGEEDADWVQKVLKETNTKL